MKPNYNSKNESPFKKGRMDDVIKPTRPKVHRIRHASIKDATVEMYEDLVQVFANKGIILSNVYSLAADLIKRGWQKHSKIEDLNEQK
jgi:hypothetical protein